MAVMEMYWTDGLSRQAKNFIRLNHIKSKKELRDWVLAGRIFPYSHCANGVKTNRELHMFVGENYAPAGVTQWYEVFTPSTGKCLLRAGISSLEELKPMLTNVAGIRKLLLTRNFGITHLREVSNHFGLTDEALKLAAGIL